MPRKMVDGVYQKLKKFCGCGKLLTGLQSRYCSKTCYTSQRKDNERIHYREHNPLIPDRICITCGENYTPRISRQQCCSRICRGEQTKIKSREFRRKNKTLKKKGGGRDANKTFSPKVSPQVVLKKVTSTKSIDKSEHASEISAYLASGGEVTVLAPQMDGRTPSVNIPITMKDFIRPSFSFDTSMGHGFELDIMDEIYTTSEVVNDL